VSGRGDNCAVRARRSPEKFPCVCRTTRAHSKRYIDALAAACTPLSISSTPYRREPAGGDDSVAIEQVRLLYANLPLSVFVSLINGVILALVQAMAIELRQVVIWLMCLFLVTVGRGVLGVRFANSIVSTANVGRWRLWFLAGVVAMALVWGAAAFVLYPPDSAALQVLLAFVLGGMVSGAVAILTPLFLAFLIFASGALIPIIVRFAMAGDDMHYAMAALGAVYLVAMLAVGKRVHRTIFQSLELSFENRALVTHLTEEKSRVEAINADLVSAQEALKKSNEALESRVAERTAALQEHDRRKDEFLAMLSHELRNPLAPMTNALYLLKATGPDGSALSHAQGVIERQLHHLVRLVDDLLDVSRINQGRIDLRREVVDLAEVVRRAAEMAQPAIDQGGHVLEMVLPDQPVYVMGDPVRLAQAASNLLVNAAKYTPKPGRVTLTLSRKGEQAAITVKDEGIGMSAELLPRVFELFVQGDDSLARPRGGLGIGLTLVQQLVQLHNGEVTAFSRGKDQGSHFTIYLPVHIQPAGKAPDAGPGRSTPSRRVLVVDDNADAANTLCSILELFGHQVRCVYDGISTLAVAEDFRPDVILLDIGLPGMDGYQVARTIRDHPALRSTKLIAVTGYGQGADRERSLAAGFDQHLTKPVDADKLHRLLIGDVEMAGRASTTSGTQ
jgi:signal transduction histidine kinase/CheY-like chemotaxis protein